MTGAVIDKAAGVDIPFTDNKNRGGARYRAALGLLMGVERTRQMMKIGFIGTGNMGGALARAAVKTVGGAAVAVACSTAEHSAKAAASIGCAAETAEAILRKSRFVFWGVKPQMFAGVTAKLAEDIAASDAVFVSMLAGVSLDRLAEMLGGEKKIIRIMPNTPSAVGQGLMLVSANDRVTAEELAAFTDFFMNRFATK